MSRLKTLAAIVVAAALVTAPSLSHATVKRAAVTSSPVTFAGYGDSNMKRTDSWVSQFTDARFTEVPGYYQNGYTSGQVLAAMPAGSSPQLAVIGLGTNDVTAGVSGTTICNNVVAIAQRSGAQHTLVLALPPQSNETSTQGINRRAVTITVNRTMTVCALDHGYMFADPWAFQRAWNGAWGTGADVGDGTHPTTLVAGQVADKMPTYMLQAVMGTSS